MEIEEIRNYEKPVTVAVYKKTANSTKHYMLVTLKSIDIVNNANAKKPLIDHKYDIVELGLGGHRFIEQWMHKYKIKKYDFVA
jgi:hypothetical protein